jgi:hypothetical protein
MYVCMYVCMCVCVSIYIYIRRYNNFPIYIWGQIYCIFSFLKIAGLFYHLDPYCNLDMIVQYITIILDVVHCLKCF